MLSLRIFRYASAMDAVLLLTKSLIYGAPEVSVSVARQALGMNSKLSALLKSPLIVGASISSSFRTLSPPERLLKLAGVHSEPKKIAYNGATSRKLIQQLDQETMNQATIVFALDLFFWDATMPSFTKTHQAMNQIVDMAREAQVPIVLGTIPKVTFRIWQADRIKINAALRELASLHPGEVLLLDMDQINLKIRSEGRFCVGDETFPLTAVAPDGIHLSAAACDYLSDRLAELLGDAKDKAMNA